MLEQAGLVVLILTGIVFLGHLWFSLVEFVLRRIRQLFFPKKERLAGILFPRRKRSARKSKKDTGCEACVFFIFRKSVFPVQQEYVPNTLHRPAATRQPCGTPTELRIHPDPHCLQ